MTCRRLVVLPLFLLPFFPLLAENPTPDIIDFGGVRLTLGMPRDQVLTLLKDRFRVEPAPAYPKQRTGLWWVYSNVAPNRNMIGTLWFPDGSLQEATLDWIPKEPTARPAVDTLRAVFGALNQHIPGDGRSCKVSLTRLPQPSSEVTGLDIACGKMIVNIYIDSRPGEDDAVSIREALAARIQSLPGKTLYQ